MEEQPTFRQIKRQQFSVIRNIVCHWLHHRLCAENYSGENQQQFADARFEFVCSVQMSNSKETLRSVIMLVNQGVALQEQWNTSELREHLKVCSVKPSIKNADIYAYRQWIREALNVIKHSSSPFIMFLQVLEWLAMAVKGILSNCTSPKEGSDQTHDLCGLVSEMIIFYFNDQNRTIFDEVSINLDHAASGQLAKLPGI